MADAAGDAVRIDAALLAQGKARQVLDAAQLSTSVDLTAFLLAAQ